MSESQGEGGSWLYGIILMVAGGLIIVSGVLTLLGYSALFDWLPADVKFLIATIGLPMIAIGVWGIIGGIGLIKDQEWGWGISLVIMSLVIVVFITDIVTGIMDAIFYGNWSNFNLWIELVAVIVAGVGIAYLLLTKYKYA